MSADISVFVQSALNITEVENASQGKFRIFSKLGDGWSTSRYRGEIVLNAYSCLPRYLVACIVLTDCIHYDGDDDDCTG